MRNAVWLYHPFHAPRGELFKDPKVADAKLEEGWLDHPPTPEDHAEAEKTRKVEEAAKKAAAKAK